MRADGTMDFDELYETGNDILKQVNRAVETGNYSDLGNTIRNLVADAIRENGTPARSAGHPSQKRDYSFSSGPAAFGQRGADVRDTSTPRVVSYGASTHFASGSSRAPFLQKPVSSFGSVVKMIGGILGCMAFGSLALIMGIASLMLFSTEGVAAGLAGLFAFGVFGVLLGLSIWLTVNGKREKDLISRFYQYGRSLGKATFFSVADLARHTGQSAAELLSDIKRMMRKGFLPQARFDEQETTVMLTEEAYDQYLAAEGERKRREAENTRSAVTETVAAQNDGASRQAQQPGTEHSPEVQAILDDGRNYLRIIREINDEIPDFDEMDGTRNNMSDQLYQLEDTMKRIFTQVEKDPSCAGELRKFMNYYLPTTEKLLRAYVEIYHQPAAGDNIAQTKHEIEDALTTINGAFTKLLDSLFQDMAWDISSDISVMRTMMAQDGLTAEGNSMEGTRQVMRADGTIETV